MKANAEALAHFAALSQEAGLVPIVEPEVLMKGRHTIVQSENVTVNLLKIVFDALLEQGVVLEQMLLKTGMVLSGSECPEQAENEVIAEATQRCLRLAVPSTVPGIIFLSGGQNEELASQRLNAICGIKGAPWKLSFSFGRALQSSALSLWSSSSDSIATSHSALRHRAQCNSQAIQGSYSNHVFMS